MGLYHDLFINLGNLWKIYGTFMGKYMENLCEIYGKFSIDLCESIYGKSMEKPMDIDEIVGNSQLKPSTIYGKCG